MPLCGKLNGPCKHWHIKRNQKMGSMTRFLCWLDEAREKPTLRRIGLGFVLGHMTILAGLLLLRPVMTYEPLALKVTADYSILFHVPSSETTTNHYLKSPLLMDQLFRVFLVRNQNAIEVSSITELGLTNSVPSIILTKPTTACNLLYVSKIPESPVFNRSLPPPLSQKN